MNIEFCEPVIFSIRRWKVKGKKSLNTIKKKLLKEREHKCAFCAGVFPNESLELDHIVPVTLNGNIFDEGNLQFLCRRCHLEKSALDRIIIGAFKKLGFIEDYQIGVYCVRHITKKSLYSLYFECFNLLVEQRRKNYETTL